MGPQTHLVYSGHKKSRLTRTDLPDPIDGWQVPAGRVHGPLTVQREHEHRVTRVRPSVYGRSYYPGFESSVEE